MLHNQYPPSALHQSFSHPHNLAQHGIFVEDNKVAMFAFLLKILLKEDQLVLLPFLELVCGLPW